MSKKMKNILIIFLAIALQGCVIVTTNYIRNETDTDLIVSVQEERQDLGWERRERKVVTITKQSICNLTTDIFHNTYFYINNPATGDSTNLSLIRNDNYIYSVGNHNKRQVVTITEADRKTKNAFKEYRDLCIEISNESE